MTTPTPGQPLSDADVSLLQPGDILKIDTGGGLYRFVRAKSKPSRLICAKKVEGSVERFYDRCRFTFVERPHAPVSRPAGEVTIRVGDDRIGPWRIWFGPPPIGTRNCDWHYQHEDDDGSCGWMSGSCGSRDECLEEIIIQYEERGS